MEKWKKKIIKAMYKQWISGNDVSAYDIISWLQNPNNHIGLYSQMLNYLYKSRWYRFYIPIRAFVYERIYPRKIIN